MIGKTGQTIGGGEVSTRLAFARRLIRGKMLADAIYAWADVL